MSKHWPPEKIVRLRPMRRSGANRSGWRGFDERRRGGIRARTVAGLLSGAFVVGALVDIAPRWTASDGGGWSEAPIEWNGVQAAPAPARDAAEIAWERRGFVEGRSSARSGRTAGGEGRPSTSSGLTGGVFRSFGLCHAGGGSNCVVDGDTFYIGGTKVRIAGIDAPETHPSRCRYEAELGARATQKLQALLNSGAVTMTSIDRNRDRYGRLLRNVQVDGADVGAAMVGDGVARDYGNGRRGWC